MKKGKFLCLICTMVSISITLTGNVLSNPIRLMQVKWSSNWHPYGGYVEGIEFVVFTEIEVPLAMLALQNGDVDAYDERVLQDYLAALARDENIEVIFTPSVRYRTLTLNCDQFPTNITAFRWAMAFGFDKYRVNVECIGGVGYPKTAIFN